jgi:hypothetical protein
VNERSERTRQHGLSPAKPALIGARRTDENAKKDMHR